MKKEATAAVTKAAGKKRPAKETPVGSRKGLRPKIQDPPPPPMVVEEVSEEESDGESEVDIGAFTTSGSRRIVGELFIDPVFMERVRLEKVMELLQFQGWGHLFQEVVAVDEDIIEEFYDNLEITEMKGNLAATFTIGDQTQFFTHRDLGTILGVSVDESVEYVQGSWPANKAKEEVILRIGEDPENKSRPGKSAKMGIFHRTLHRLVQCTLAPRMQKHDKVYFNDYLLIDKLVRKEFISLPKIIMLHMERIVKLNRAMGYPSVVKKILQHYKMYSPKDEGIVSIMMNQDMFESLGWYFDEVDGWYNEKLGIPAVPITETPPAVVKEEIGGSDTSEVKDVLFTLMAKMNSLEGMVARLLSQGEGSSSRSGSDPDLVKMLKGQNSVIDKLVGQIGELRKEVQAVAAYGKALVPVTRT